MFTDDGAQKTHLKNISTKVYQDWLSSSGAISVRTLVESLKLDYSEADELFEYWKLNEYIMPLSAESRLYIARARMALRNIDSSFGVNKDNLVKKFVNEMEEKFKGKIYEDLKDSNLNIKLFCYLKENCIYNVKTAVITQNQDEFILKLTSWYSGIECNKLKSGRLGETDWVPLIRTAGEIMDWSWEIYEPIENLDEQITMLKEKKFSLILIDKGIDKGTLFEENSLLDKYVVGLCNNMREPKVIAI